MDCVRRAVTTSSPTSFSSSLPLRPPHILRSPSNGGRRGANSNATAPRVSIMRAKRSSAACPAQHHHDLVAAAGDCTPRDGAAPLVGREVIVGDRGPRWSLIRQPVDAEVRGEAVQFIDSVGQQMRPLQALPAPDRIIDIERHIPPRHCPSQRPGTPKSACRRQSAVAKLALLHPRRQEGTRLKRGVAGAPHLRARWPLPCVREEPSAGIAVEPIQVRGQVRQVP